MELFGQYLPETTKLIFMKDVKGIYDEENFYFSGC